jgi:hypothetical protein
MKTINKTTRSLCGLGTAIAFLTFLVASAPHRVHHLLENVPAPKSTQPRLAALSIYSAPNPQGSIARSADSQAQSFAHDHSSHSHRHNGKAGHRRSHAHSHSHSHAHSHDAAPVQTQSAAAPAPSSASEPLHANAPKRDAHHDGSARTDCIVQAAAQHAHYTPDESAVLTFHDAESALRLAVRSENFTPFDPSPFSQRAPPRA